MIIVNQKGGQANQIEVGSTHLANKYYTPLLFSSGCPKFSSRSYRGGYANQFDRDDPVRLADQHADKNLALRGYVQNWDPNQKKTLINMGSDDPTRPPQFATLFSPARVPNIKILYQVGQWIWATSPNPGKRGDPIPSPPVTAMGLEAIHGEVLQVPSSGYDIGGGMEVLVLFADKNSITLRYSREDSAGSAGYTVHIDNICTDPNLLALYNRLDAPDGPRYVYVPPSKRPYGYDLPILAAGQVFGTAYYGEVVVAIVDTGKFWDPRSCNEWWQVRPGYNKSC